MRYRMIVAAAAVSTFGWSSAAAQCVRHAYNNSQGIWTVTFTPQVGTVAFQNFCSGQSCVIPPGGVVEIDYYGGLGAVSIVDETGVSNGWTYGSEITFECPQFIHYDGNTGAVALNDPANGDLHMWGPNTWGAGLSAAIPPRRRVQDVNPRPELRLPDAPDAMPASDPGQDSAGADDTAPDN